MTLDVVRELVMLHDVARCLALAEQGRLRLYARGRGGLHRRTVDLLCQHLMLCAARAGADGVGSGSAELSFLVALLREGGLLSAAKGNLWSTAVARHWLAAPPESQLAELRAIWWDHREIVAQCLPRRRSRDLPPGRWREVTLSVARRITALPCTRWTSATDIEESLTRQGVPLARGRGANLPRVRQATARRMARTAGLMLHTVLPCLGLIRIREDGQRPGLRPTREGAAWLQAAMDRLEEARQPDGQGALDLALPDAGPLPAPATGPRVSVDEHLCVTIQPAAPASRTFDIAHFARLLPSPGPAARYEITRQTLEEGIRWGYSVPVASFVLARATDGHLPLGVVEQPGGSQH